jgi:hypothetical protein
MELSISQLIPACKMLLPFTVRLADAIQESICCCEAGRLLDSYLRTARRVTRILVNRNWEGEFLT